MASKSLSAAVPPKNFNIITTTEGVFCNELILCRLIHFWEARNFKLGNILMGFEILLIDSEGNLIQGFVSANRLFRFERDLKANSVYKLKRFMIKECKACFKTSDHKHDILFTNQTIMVEVPEGADNIDHQKFRPRLFSDFSAIANTETNLFGRDGAGKCFCLYHQRKFEILEDSPKPEIKRCNLSNVILQMKALSRIPIL